MKKVLMITYAFPPIGGIGVLRTVKFAQYLPEFGWEPMILTVAQGDDFVFDDSLLAMLPKDIKIFRTRSWEPFNVTRAKRAADQLAASSQQKQLKQKLLAGLKSLYFALRIPDDKIGWLPFAVQQGKRIIQQENPDLLFATAPPYTDFLVGHALKRASHKPLVVDYRDEWSTMRYRDIPINPLTDFANRKLEEPVLRAADAVVTAIEPIIDRLRAAKLLPASACHVNIPNGFDPTDYADQQMPNPGQRNAKFSIVYTGSFYGARQTPLYFLQGLARFLQAKPDVRGQIQVSFVGKIYEKHTQLIRQFALDDVVKVVGFVPHKCAIEHQLAADVLLLVVGKGAGSEVVLTGKIFEYLGAGRPILALVPQGGPAAELIHKTATGVTVDAEDVDGVCRAIGQYYEDWRNGRVTFTPDTGLVNQYSRRMLTAKLAEVFNTLTI